MTYNMSEAQLKTFAEINAPMHKHIFDSIVGMASASDNEDGVDFEDYKPKTIEPIIKSDNE